MDYALKGRHVLVTGGATGIGLAAAAAFIAEGARATVSGLKQDEVDHALDVLGSEARGMACDLTAAGTAEERAQPCRDPITSAGA